MPFQSAFYQLSTYIWICSAAMKLYVFCSMWCELYLQLLLGCVTSRLRFFIFLSCVNSTFDYLPSNSFLEASIPGCHKLSHDRSSSSCNHFSYLSISYSFLYLRIPYLIYPFNLQHPPVVQHFKCFYWVPSLLSWRASLALHSVYTLGEISILLSNLGVIQTYLFSEEKLFYSTSHLLLLPS